MNFNMAVLLIAKKTKDALSGVEKDLAFSSNRSCMIEMFSDNIELTTDGDGNGTLEITHNLGYVPAFFMFEKGYLDTLYWYPQYAMQVYATTTKLIVKANCLDANTTYNIFYSISGNRQDDAEGSGNNNVSGRLRISKSGYDAETEMDVRNMRFISGKNVPKIDEDLSGSITETINSDYPYPTLITIPHNLGYVPVCFVFDSDLGKILPYTVPLYGGASMIHHVDDTNLYIEARSGENPESETFKYIILRDKIA